MFNIAVQIHPGLLHAINQSKPLARACYVKVCAQATHNMHLRCFHQSKNNVYHWKQIYSNTNASTIISKRIRVCTPHAYYYNEYITIIKNSK